MTPLQDARIGFIGLGQMGLGIAINLLRSGRPIVGLDLRTEACDAFRRAGGAIAADATLVVEQSDIVITSLVSPVYLKLVDDVFLRAARPGQVFIDTSTIPAPRARELARRFGERGAAVLDAPVTGGRDAAHAGTLRMFVGGDRDTFDASRPLLQYACRDDGITYGGAAGMGQVLKVVQQLKDRITDAVRMEVIAFGTRCGLSLDQVRRALDVTRGSKDPYARIVDAIEQGNGDSLDVVFAEWAYYLEAAADQNIPMPALESLYHFCRDGDPVCRDGVGRMAPSVWRELSTKPARPGSTR